MSLKINDGSTFSNRSGGSVSIRTFYWNGSSYVEDTDAIIFQGPPDQNPKTATGGRNQVNDIWINTGAADPVPGQLIARTVYNPASLTTYSTAIATYADMDATNLSITFIVPLSGGVEITLNALTAVSTTSASTNWGLRESTTDLGGPQRVSAAQVAQARCTAYFFVTGLTPGSSHTYKWSHANSAATGAGRTFVGSTSGTGADGGPCVMEVRAL